MKSTRIARPVDGAGYEPTETMSPLDQAIRDGAGVPVLDLRWSGGAKHDHVFRLMRVVFPQWGDDVSYYIEVGEPGACQCELRVDLSRLIHAVLNLGLAGVDHVERGAVCACGHRHHLDDAVSR